MSDHFDDLLLAIAGNQAQFDLAGLNKEESLGCIAAVEQDFAFVIGLDLDRCSQGFELVIGQA